MNEQCSLNTKVKSLFCNFFFISQKVNEMYQKFDRHTQEQARFDQQQKSNYDSDRKM